MEKFNKENHIQLEFLKKNVRDFYSKDVVVWQYENDAYSSGLFFSKEKDAYIASQGMIPIFLKAHGKRILTAKSESTFLLPEFRGKGIIEDLYFYTIQISVQDGVQIIWGFTALSNVWRKKLKFDVYEGLIHESELQIHFFKSLFATWKSDNSFSSKIKLSLKSFISLIKGKLLPHANTDYTAGYLDIKNDVNLNLIVDLYNEWESNYPDMTNILMDTAFLNWRIANNPIVKYKIIGVYKNQKLVGIGIVNDSESKAYLLDFIVPKKEHLNYCFIELLRCVKKHNSVSHLIYWASHKNEYANSIHALFQSMGAFRYVNNNMNFVFKKTEKYTIPEININDIYINGLWTEGFRI